MVMVRSIGYTISEIKGRKKERKKERKNYSLGESTAAIKSMQNVLSLT